MSLNDVKPGGEVTLVTEFQVSVETVSRATQSYIWLEGYRDRFKRKGGWKAPVDRSFSVFPFVAFDAEVAETEAILCQQRLRLHKIGEDYGGLDTWHWVVSEMRIATDRQRCENDVALLKAELEQVTKFLAVQLRYRDAHFERSRKALAALNDLGANPDVLYPDTKKNGPWFGQPGVFK